MGNVVDALFTTTTGAWLGLLVALFLFSAIVGDHFLARLAQHILVGAGLGYAALLSIREVLLPRIATAWLAANDAGWVWVPLVLGLLLWLAGLDHLLRPAPPKDDGLAGWRQLLRHLGLVPVMLMVGVGVTVALLGVIQGTLLPQIGVLLGDSIRADAPPLVLASGLLALLLATATLLHLTWAEDAGAVQLPRWLRAPADLWRWVGLRALWLAAGILFARLAAARLSLLIGWYEFVGQTLQQTGLWGWIEWLLG
ncbi:MAG: hypothetical protein DCC55_15835 [Chloroflexi bacterium]|nr:MAG: hypothetical protein DCC55_15835 [Chloroflexota bacterium]